MTNQLSPSQPDRLEPEHPDYGHMLSLGDRFAREGFRLHLNVFPDDEGNVDYDALGQLEIALEEQHGSGNVRIVPVGYHLDGTVWGEVEWGIWVRKANVDSTVDAVHQT